MRDWTYYTLQTVYYVILFFILREWLVPVIELTSTGYLSIFLLFIVICFVFNILPLPFYIGALCKLLYIAWFITIVYGQVSLVSGEAVAFLVDDIGRNLNALTTMHINDITNSLRTFLFFVLVWMLAYLMNYWLTVKRSIFYFLVLTVFFIATIDTFTEYDGSRGIIVTLLLGLILTAMLYVQKLTATTQTKLSVGNYARYVVPMVFMISVIGVAAFFMPKAEAQWPDPVPFIKNLAGGGDEEKQKVGIDDDDSQLGGAFAGDDTVVYEIIADKPQYWRVEHKIDYDSKGWGSSNNINTIDMYPDELTGDIQGGPIENDTVAIIESKTDNTFVIQPYTAHGMSYDVDNVSLKMDSETHRLSTYVSDEKIALEQYEIGFSEPEYSYTTLKEPLVDYAGEFSDLIGNYSDLPTTVPDRVFELAWEITEDYESVYDKAKAVERYFKSSGFRYETEDVAIPAEGQDYVDQFLFETKAGYCDNFSTSMVVMMRSIGIPARWVKGYAEGRDIGNTEDGKNIYEVTNNDAHSWVEVYVPEIGWMPFEPTIGFNASHDIDFDMELDIDTPEADEAKQEQQLIERDRKQAEDVQTQIAKQERSRLPYILAALAVLSAAVLLFMTRKRWMQLLPNAKPTTVKGAYRSLEKRLAKQGIVRKQGETLRAFARRVDRSLESEYMTKFVAVYERTLYSAEKSADFLEIQESYEYLINRIDG